MPLNNLHKAAFSSRNHASSSSSNSAPADVALDADTRTGVRTYKWMQFEGREHVTEFDDSHFELEGRFESNSSAGHKEYQARIRAIYLRKQGKGKSEIARILGRSERYVGKWWQKQEQEVPKPWGVHGFLGGEMGFDSVQSGAKISEDTATDAATWWRDVEIRRGFVKDPAIYKEVMENAAWEGLPSNTKDFRTGAAVMKYTKDGSVCIQSYQKAKYSPGLSPATDRALQKLFAEFGIEGRTVGVLLNRYDDGEAMLGSHRHDCWTALFSFGSERILTIDHTPLLCQDGDLVIFGTQRHGVPKMPAISTGRVTVVVFFYPNHLQQQKMWQTVSDPDTMESSRALVAIQHDTMLGTSAQEWALWGLGGKGSEALSTLKRIGLADDEQSEAAAKEALLAHKMDPVTAAAACLRRSTSLAEALQKKLAVCSRGMVDLSHSNAGKGRWARRGVVAEGASLKDEVGDPSPLEGLSVEDVRLGLDALKLTATSPDCDMLMPSGERPKFKAEDWDGVSGDLVAHFLRGGNVQLKELDSMIKLDEMDPVALLSVGLGSISERALFDALRSHDIGCVYDLRASESLRETRANHSAAQHLSSKNLRLACKSRCIVYKPIAVGRESAHGVVAHLRNPEGQHALLELAWQGQRRPTAFLGSDEDWRHDGRLAIAEDLTRAGHIIDHLEIDGSLTRHQLGTTIPDWMLREEERLKKVETMRHAGDLQRKQKSAVDRSTETVALRLMQPAEEVDTMSVLKDAANQQELKFAQRRLAATHRYSEKQELPKKKLTGAPKFIAEEARLQGNWVAAQKTMSKDKAASSDDPGEHGAAEDASGDLQVECLSCGDTYSWAVLRASDGLCCACADAAAMAVASENFTPSHVSGLDDCSNGGVVKAPAGAAADDLMVECATCSVAAPWSVLHSGDGHCSQCCFVDVDTCTTSASSLAEPCTPLSSGTSQPFAGDTSGDMLGDSRWRRRCDRETGKEALEMTRSELDKPACVRVGGYVQTLPP